MSYSVAIEGIDGSGKGTQAAILHDRLSKSGKTSSLISFPRYTETSFGKRVGEFLNGVFGQLDEVPPELVSLLYAGDRLESLSFLKKELEANSVVVFDRFVPSNIAHQGAKLEVFKQDEFVKWIQHVEYEVYKIPRPNQIILLDVPAEYAQSNVLKKQARDYTKQKTDLQESDLNYLATVRDFYLKLANENPSWSVIDSCDANGKLRGIEDIADEIESRVLSKIEA